MADTIPPRRPSEAPIILPADPLGGGLTVIEVEKAEHAVEEDGVKAARQYDPQTLRE